MYQSALANETRLHANEDHADVAVNLALIRGC